MKVSNPLTIIAIFAGIAEAFATGALVMLPPELQANFMIFVMAFPTAIVTTFFIILWFRPVVLYAPSDYDDPEHFLVANKLKNTLSLELEKFFSRLSEENRPIQKDDIPSLVEELRESVLQSAETGLEQQIINYLKERPREVFTDRALGHIFSVGRRSVRETLELLEEKDIVVRGIERATGTILWQIKT